jgi:hypothetical protein
MERILSDHLSENSPQWHLHAGIAGWLIPGLGHIVLGQRKRGIILMIAILSLWGGGILIGGISVIDQYDRTEPQPTATKLTRSWWFYGQAMIGPSIVVERMRNSMAHSYAQQRADHNGYGVFSGDPRTVIVPTQEGEEIAPPYEPSLARVAEQGTLFTALAGLLNLLAIMDAMYCDPKRRMRFENPQAYDDAVEKELDELDSAAGLEAAK